MLASFHVRGTRQKRKACVVENSESVSRSPIQTKQIKVFELWTGEADGRKPVGDGGPIIIIINVLPIGKYDET